MAATLRAMTSPSLRRYYRHNVTMAITLQWAATLPRYDVSAAATTLPPLTHCTFNIALATILPQLQLYNGYHLREATNYDNHDLTTADL